MTTYHPDTTLLDEPQGDGKNVLGTARAAGAQAREIAATTRRQVADTTGRAKLNSTRFVQENPFLAIVGAVGVGVLIGLSLRTR